MKATEDSLYKLLLSQALRAICLTRDYVGADTLPAIKGWEWYDAGKALAEAIPDDEWAKQFRLRIARQERSTYNERERQNDERQR